MIAYKVVTVTHDPKVFKPWLVEGPSFEALKYTVGLMTKPEDGCGPIVAFPDYYDALQMYHRMPINRYDTPMAIIKCDCRLSEHRAQWGHDRVSPPYTQNMPKVVYCDSIYVIERMPVGAIESYED